MCDYSLMNNASRPAVVGEKLVTKNFGTGTTGFCPAGEKDKVDAVAVCVLPGTEIAFETEAKKASGFFDLMAQPAKSLSKVAVFRQIDKDCSHTHHDALEFSNGQIVKLTSMLEGQCATVLQLPAAPKTESEAKEQERLVVAA
jgi:hypothetical protein